MKTISVRKEIVDSFTINTEEYIKVKDMGKCSDLVELICDNTRRTKGCNYYYRELHSLLLDTINLIGFWVATDDSENETTFKKRISDDSSLFCNVVKNGSEIIITLSKHTIEIKELINK